MINLGIEFLRCIVFIKMMANVTSGGKVLSNSNYHLLR